MTFAALSAKRYLATARRVEQPGNAFPRSTIDDGEPERVWFDELFADASPRQQVVFVLNERLADVARDADVGSEIPRVSARIALTSGTLLAVLSLVQGMNQKAAIWAGGTFAVAVASALVASELGRLSRRRAQEQLETWNAVVRAITPLLPPSTEEPKTKHARE